MCIALPREKSPILHVWIWRNCNGSRTAENQTGVMVDHKFIMRHKNVTLVQKKIFFKNAILGWINRMQDMEGNHSLLQSTSKASPEILCVLKQNISENRDPEVTNRDDKGAWNVNHMRKVWKKQEYLVWKRRGRRRGRRWHLQFSNV